MEPLADADVTLTLAFAAADIIRTEPLADVSQHTAPGLAMSDAQSPLSFSDPSHTHARTQARMHACTRARTHAGTLARIPKWAQPQSKACASSQGRACVRV